MLVLVMFSFAFHMLVISPPSPQSPWPPVSAYAYKHVWFTFSSRDGCVIFIALFCRSLRSTPQRNSLGDRFGPPNKQVKESSLLVCVCVSYNLFRILHCPSFCELSFALATGCRLVVFSILRASCCLSNVEDDNRKVGPPPGIEKTKKLSQNSTICCFQCN